MKSGQEVFRCLKYNICFAMSSSTTTFISNGTSGTSASSNPLGYWSNQNYHFYQHYAYQNGGGIVHQQFPYQQHHGMTENAGTVYQPQECGSSPIHAPAEGQNNTTMLAQNTKYSTNLPSMSYSVVGLNQKKPTSSPNSLQNCLNMSDERFHNRYISNSSTSSMYQNHYLQTNHGIRSPPPETRNTQITRSPSPRIPEHDGSFSSIHPQPVIDVKKESTSPILGMLLNRTNAPKVSPSVSHSAGYQEFYSPSPSGTTVREFTSKDRSAEERDVSLHHQYVDDAGTSTSAKTSEGEEVASRQGFGNISPPQSQMEFPHGRFEDRKLPLDCMQPVIPYGVDGGGRAKVTSHIQQNNFYPWMKSYSGELLQP